MTLRRSQALGLWQPQAMALRRSQALLQCRFRAMRPLHCLHRLRLRKQSPPFQSALSSRCCIGSTTISTLQQAGIAFHEDGGAPPRVIAKIETWRPSSELLHPTINSNKQYTHVIVSAAAVILLRKGASKRETAVDASFQRDRLAMQRIRELVAVPHVARCYGRS